ncbi:ABC transporter permease, partial [Vibrio parahaemolyticus]
DVEQAWPHKEKLSLLERDLQSNYDIGRATVDYKLATGKWNWLYDEHGNLDVKKYAEEINKATPRSQSEIIIQYLGGTDLLPKQ